MKKTLVNILFLMVVSSAAMGQLPEQYLVKAAENNQGLRAKFLAYQAALERVPQVGTLPDPTLSFGLSIMPMERYMGDQIMSISLMQMFPWFGTLEAAKNEMTHMARAQFEAFHEARSVLFYEVRITYYALLLLEEEIAITRENIALLETLQKIALIRFKSGGQSPDNTNAPGSMRSPGMEGGTPRDQAAGGMDMRSANPLESTASAAMKPMDDMNNMGGGTGMIDVIRVQMEINELQNKLTLLEESKAPLLARFNLLLNKERTEPVELPDTIIPALLPVSLVEISDSIKLNNPMLKMYAEKEAAFIAQGKMNERMGLPMVGVGVQYDVFRPRPSGESMMNGRNMLMPMATVTIPLWRKSINASVRESDLLRQSIVEMRQDAGDRLMVSYEEALRDFNDAERRNKLYQEQTALATQALNILVVKYTTAGTRFEEVLRMQQQLLDYRLLYLDALIDGHMAAAMLDRLMGR